MRNNIYGTKYIYIKAGDNNYFRLAVLNIDICLQMNKESFFSLCFTFADLKHRITQFYLTVTDEKGERKRQQNFTFQ